MYPENAVARELFGRVGGLLVPRDETTFDAFSAATATFAAHLDYLTMLACANDAIDRERVPADCKVDETDVPRRGHTSSTASE